MKVLQINSVYGIKSTGRIAQGIAKIQKENSAEPYVVCSEGNFDGVNAYVMKTGLYQKANILLTRLFGKHGFYNKIATRKMLKWADSVKPDIIHLHNIHGHYINVRLLFEYIKKNNIPVVWTLHDCWAFTGHCAHFDYAGCDKWQKGCGGCSIKRSYPVSMFFDRSKGNYKAKKELFTSVEKMHVVTPSDWLKGLCEKSYLGKYPVTTIHNGVDTEVFSPAESDLRARLKLEDKFVILGIVNKFSGTKGGEYFLKLSQLLSEDERIVLLSLDEEKEKIPQNIISLPSTADVKELAEIYSMADVFVNPTLQDTFPTVNIEALCSGTPVVTFDTGGSKEALDEKSGYFVPKTDVEAMYGAIQKIKSGSVNPEDCRARGLQFNKDDRFREYVNIYKSVLK